MTYKTKHMDNAERCNYSQKNNGYEAALGDEETCGPTAAVSCLNSVGFDTLLVPFVQEEDIVTSYFLNSNNFLKFVKVRPNLVPGSINGNRVPQYYQVMIEDLFQGEAVFAYGDIRVLCLEYMKKGCALHLLLSKGHYIAGVGYDKGNEELIYNDPMGGFNLRMPREEFGEFEQFATIIYPKD